MKKLLILGAGVYQLPLIRRARERGFWTIAASWSGGDPGMAAADEAWEVDTTDREKLLELSGKRGIDGVATSGTDVATPTIGHLCDRLGLPGIGYETALASSNKVLMQERFRAARVPSARSREVRDPQEAAEAFDELGAPAIVKASDSSGSRGVTVVEDRAGIAGAFECARRASRGGGVLIEEFLSGEEFGAQLVVCAGKVVECICHNDTVTPPPVTVPIGHSCPTRLCGPALEETARVCQAAVGALGIVDAVCNADLIATPDGVRVLEIGARIGGTGIPEIVRLHCGLDLYDVALDLACGASPSCEVRPVRAAAVAIIRAPHTGVLVSRSAPPETLSLPGVVSVRFDYPAGAAVRAFRTGPDRIGDVLVTAESADAAERLCERVLGALEIGIAPEQAGAVS